MCGRGKGTLRQSADIILPSIALLFISVPAMG
jgi:hypothetical protein